MNSHRAVLAAAAFAWLLAAACAAPAPSPAAVAPLTEPPPAPIAVADPVDAHASLADAPSAEPAAEPTVEGPTAEVRAPGGDASGDEAAPAASAETPAPPPQVVVAAYTPAGTPFVVIDPGHGADEIGAAGNGLVEKESNLDMALRVEALLLEAGIGVLMTRREDARAVPVLGTAAFGRQRQDLQARIDMANESGAHALVSIHSNGISDTSIRGLETYFNGQRPFADRSKALASFVHRAVLQETAAIGRPLVDRGVRDDTCIYGLRGGVCRSIFLIGPERITTRQEVIRRGGDPEALGFLPDQQGVSTRASQMPGTVVELLFITNALDAAMLKDEAVRQAMARGVARGVLDFLRHEGVLTSE